MASEIQFSVNVSFTKNGATLNSSDSSAINVAGTKYTDIVQNIGTSDEVLALGDVGTIGVVKFKNLDATNFITLGSNGTSYPIKLKAGEFAAFRWSGAAIHAKADTAACDLQAIIIED